MTETRDRFGNVIDPVVGYARGSILKGAVEEQRRREKVDQIIRELIARGGREAVHNFSGLDRGFPIRTEDIDEGLLDGFLGYPRFENELKALAFRHLGGSPQEHSVSFFSRVTAGIVATMLTLSKPDELIVSVVPGGHAHPSFRHGANLARARFEEITDGSRTERLRDLLAREHRVSLVALTGITMWWQIFSVDEFRALVEIAHQADKIVFVDDAAAGVRYVVGNQPPALAMGADLAICSGDKGGLSGPRCGFMAGKAALVARIGARAVELGMEAQPQVRLGLLRSLQNYSRERIAEDYRAQLELRDLARRRYGDHVSTSSWYLNIDADDVLEIALKRCHTKSPLVTPSEAASALGLIQLRDYGILTVTAFGAPGATLALRFKLTHKAAIRFGGNDKIMEVLDESFGKLARLIADPPAVQELLLG